MVNNGKIAVSAATWERLGAGVMREMAGGVSVVSHGYNCVVLEPRGGSGQLDLFGAQQSSPYERLTAYLSQHRAQVWTEWYESPIEYVFHIATLAPAAVSVWTADVLNALADSKHLSGGSHRLTDMSTRVTASSMRTTIVTGHIEQVIARTADDEDQLKKQTAGLIGSVLRNKAADYIRMRPRSYVKILDVNHD